LADNIPPQARACLARRRKLLDTPRAELMQTAREHHAATERVLRAWAAFDVPPDATAGIPLGVKDVIDAKGFPTRAGSQARRESPEMRVDADVVSRLARMGVRTVGKTVTTEFAYLDAGPTTNPFSQLHTPGGSSSGSAAAVGAGVVPLALGTQTAGSVCRPAAYCGTYAFKPSTGRTPSSGVVPFAPSFDTVGVFGLDPALVAEAGACMLGIAEPPLRSAQTKLRIGYLEDEYYLDIAPECAAALDDVTKLLAGAGHELVPLRLGWQFELLRAEHRCVMHHEAWVNHGALLDGKAGLLGPHWRNALEAGRSFGAARVASARECLQRAKDYAQRIMEAVDFVLVPPVRSVAPAGIGSTGDAGLIVPWTFIGSPLAVVPTGLTAQGMPLAVMLAGKPGADADAILAFRHICNLLQANDRCVDRASACS
jgi:aspartyl-tRNA(Asn)/glutamyl-tRNA(Gln) amidotransferase subunit A